MSILTRKVVFGCAMSLDGYIAGPNGEYEWIIHDPDVDFREMFARFDTFLVGRKPFESMLRAGNADKPFPGIQNIICSKTLNPADYPKQTIRPDAAAAVRELQQKPGKDIAIFEGGDLFRSLLEAGLASEVDLAIVPVLLGSGVALLPAPSSRSNLKLVKHHIYQKTGIARLHYEVQTNRNPST